jgi:hypothetical protein
MPMYFLKMRLSLSITFVVKSSSNPQQGDKTVFGRSSVTFLALQLSQIPS